MKVIPQSHHNGFSEYEAVDATQNIFGTQIKPEQVDEASAVFFSLQPYQCSLHEARIIQAPMPTLRQSAAPATPCAIFPPAAKCSPNATRTTKSGWRAVATWPAISTKTEAGRSRHSDCPFKRKNSKRRLPSRQVPLVVVLPALAWCLQPPGTMRRFAGI